MNDRMLRRLTVLLIVLLVVYGGVRLVSFVTRPQASSGGALGDALSSLRGDTLVGATITSPGGARIAVERGAAGWTVNGHTADSVAVDDLTRAAGNARVLDLVAQNAQSHARLGVTPDSAWNVELRGRRDTVQLLLGGTGRRYDQAYVRAPGADEVYEVAGDLRQPLTRTLSDWRSKVVVRVDTAAVRSVVLERDRRTFAVQRGDSLWTPRGATGTVEQYRVSDVLRELARFEVAGFAPESVAFAGAQLRRVVALGASGDTVAALEFRGDSTMWYARVRGDSTVYEVSSYQLDRLVPLRADVIK